MQTIMRISFLLFLLSLLPLSLCAQVVPSRDADGAHHRWRQLNQIRRDKFDLILPSVMRENGIDMWIIMAREGNFDPIHEFLGGGYVGHNAFYIFTDRGGSRIERTVLGAEGYLIEQTGAWDRFGDESELAEFVRLRDPKKIGLNMSKDIGGEIGRAHV